jgi:hypothetical protein
MDFIKQNAGIITIMLFLVTSALLLYILIKNNKIYKNFFVKRFGFNNLKDIDINTKEEKFSVNVINKSFSDTTVNAAGLIYDSQYFDFKELYIKSNNINDNKILISQRSYIKLNLDINEIKNLIYPKIVGKRLNCIYTYVIDSFGNTSKEKAYTIRKVLRTDYKNLLKEEAKKAKEKRKSEKKADAENFLKLLAEKKAKGEKISFKEFLKRLKINIFG